MATSIMSVLQCIVHAADIAKQTPTDHHGNKNVCLKSEANIGIGFRMLANGALLRCCL